MLNRVAHPKGFEDEEPRRGNRDEVRKRPTAGN